jgi:phosphoribosylanthranilate isomerase
VRVKICGVTSVADALDAVSAGADAIGVNLVAASPRRVDEATALAIARAVRGRALAIGVVADRAADELASLRRELELDLLQLCGDESPETLAALLPGAYKALRIGSAGDVERAAGYGGELLLVDARVDGVLGGSGRSFDWGLVAGLAAERPLMLAGGLGPDNVARAIAVVRPAWVDVASGVEGALGPRRKDAALVQAFVRAARGAC